ncbi:MAG: isoaspartyl peptidase/L-asparaginase [Bacteroidales bacterium]|nr:isoaspartyl peptidase/L-asparaginase [Bacteroidales bacterium]
MKRILALLNFLVPVLFCLSVQSQQNFAIVIHGGAGNVIPENYPEERQKKYTDVLEHALDTGILILEQGGTSIDAVEQVIIILENSPLFNAGKGAVFTNEGRNELDASIMEGKTLNSGAVAAVGDIKNPIRAARKVMEESEHVLLIGNGASRFAAEHGLEIVDSSYFYTEQRWKSLERIRKTSEAEKYGTVGCVAFDQEGNLAAGTSTGGMTNKRYGRVGDAPIIGAGTYANNNSCAVSATGHGEFFIRYTVAHDISALMQYADLSLQEAASKVIQEKLKNAGGMGGIIAIDNQGNIVMEFNTSGMFRAFANASGDRGVLMFKE